MVVGCEEKGKAKQSLGYKKETVSCSNRRYLLTLAHSP